MAEAKYKDEGFGQATVGMLIHGRTMESGFTWGQAHNMATACTKRGLRNGFRLVAVPAADLSAETGTPNGTDPDESAYIGGLVVGVLLASATADATVQGVESGSHAVVDDALFEKARSAWDEVGAELVEQMKTIAPEGSWLDEEQLQLVPAGPLAAAWLHGVDGSVIRTNDGEEKPSHQASTEGAGPEAVELHGRYKLTAQYD